MIDIRDHGGFFGGGKTKITGQTEDFVPFGETIANSDPVYTKRSFIKQPDLNNGTSNPLDGVAWSPDGQYIAAAGTAAPYIHVWKKSGDTFTKLPEPTAAGNGGGKRVAFSPDGQHLLLTLSSSPYLAVYKIENDILVRITPIPNPGIGELHGLAISKSGIYTVVGKGFSGSGVVVLKRNGDTYTILTSPFDIIPNSLVRGCAFSHDDEYLAIAHSGEPNLFVYKRTGDTFAKLPDPAILPGGSCYGVTFSISGPKIVYLSLNSSSNPVISYKVEGTTLTRLPDPVSGLSSIGYGIGISPDGRYVCGMLSAQQILLYRTSQGRLDRTLPDIEPTTSGNDAAYSPDGLYLALALNNGRIGLYKTSLSAHVIAPGVPPGYAEHVGYATQNGVAGEVKKIISYFR